MTTMDATDLKSYLLYRLSKPRVKRARKAIGWRGIALSFVRVMLHLGGFGFLTYAGFQFNMITGLAVAGVSCFVLSHLLTGGSETPRDPMSRG